MAHTFDIRFARTAGFAALLEAPTNSFRWTGAGRLSIDAQGVSIAVKRGLSSLLAHNGSRRILAANLKEVFREGDALRVEFATDESSRASLLFWADDRATAAKIVQLLPTSRTVELEERAAATEFQFNRRALVLLGGLGLALIGAMLWFTLSRATSTIASPPTSAEAPVLDAATLAVEAPGSVETAPVPTGRRFDSTASMRPIPLDQQSLPEPRGDGALPSAPYETVGAGFTVVSIARGTPERAEALRQLALFRRDADELVVDYGHDFETFLNSGMSVDDLATRLTTYERRWWEVTFRILDSDGFSAPVLADLRSTLLASARYRRRFLAMYAEGLRTRDTAMIQRAFLELKRADDLHAHARRYQD